MSQPGKRALRAGLRRALLVGAALAGAGCMSSSCPDNGVEPPLTGRVPIAATEPDPSAETCRALCHDVGDSLITCVRASPTEVLCIGTPFPCEGRRPQGWVPPERREANQFERFLADAAQLEAASVAAFALLSRELRELRAPRRLIRAAERARRDERRHARVSSAVARHFRATVAPVTIQAKRGRSLEEVALDNAIEGCVRETWGALIVLHQAEHATEPLIRAAACRIARDEVFHAEFSWMLAEWCAPRVSPSARRRIQTACEAAVAELEREACYEMPEADRKRLGLPAPRAASAMLGELRQSLWV